MILHYDRDGVPIDTQSWGELVADKKYQRVLRTTVADAADPAKAYDVSTVWLGIDHNWGRGVPLIFETMVFGTGSEDMIADRYSTEELARGGHNAMVVSICATLIDPVVMEVVEDAGRYAAEPAEDADAEGRTL